MRLLPLHGILGKAKRVTIDDEDFNRISQYKWYYDGRYVIRYLDARIGSSQRLHRFILNAQKGQMIDHINRNPLDNTKANLRFCTPSENNSNRTPKEIDFTKYRIVTKKSMGNVICKLCTKRINNGETYYNGQKVNRAHTSCVV